MSKASEYSEALKRADALEPVPFHVVDDGSLRRIARVDDDGMLVIEDCDLDPSQALELMAWIGDTFGEPAA